MLFMVRTCERLAKHDSLCDLCYNLDNFASLFFSVTREKSLDLAKKQSSRNVYQCHVIGQQKSGKSSFCACHIGHTLDVIILISVLHK